MVKVLGTHLGMNGKLFDALPSFSLEYVCVILEMLLITISSENRNSQALFHPIYASVCLHEWVSEEQFTATKQRQSQRRTCTCERAGLCARPRSRLDPRNEASEDI